MCSSDLRSPSFGISYLSSSGTGCYSYVFYDRIAELHRIFGDNPANLLGYVMAHEVAHLLLGTNSHSASGIMRAQWYREDLDLANRGALLFSDAQAKIMKERIRCDEDDRN